MPPERDRLRRSKRGQLQLQPIERRWESDHVVAGFHDEDALASDRVTILGLLEGAGLLVGAWSFSRKHWVRTSAVVLPAFAERETSARRLWVSCWMAEETDSRPIRQRSENWSSRRSLNGGHPGFRDHRRSRLATSCRETRLASGQSLAAVRYELQVARPQSRSPDTIVVFSAVLPRTSPTRQSTYISTAQALRALALCGEIPQLAN